MRGEELHGADVEHLDRSEPGRSGPVDRRGHRSRHRHGHGRHSRRDRPDRGDAERLRDGARTCTKAKVLSLRLTEPKGVDFKTASFFINGKKKKKASRAALFYAKGKKRGKPKTIKISNLPNSAIELVIKVTTTKGQRLTITRSIAKCDIASKKPKPITTKKTSKPSTSSKKS